MHKWALFLTLAIFWSCNTISSEDFVMNDQNTDRFKVQKQYWVGLDEDGKVSDTVGYSARGFTPKTKRKVWMLDLQPNPQNLPPVYIRFQPNGENQGVYQITSYDEDGRHINFLYGKYDPQKGELTLYEPSEKAIQSFKSFKPAKGIQSQVKLKKDDLIFSKAAAQSNADIILQYLKSLNQNEHFKDSLVLKGTDDQQEFNSWLKPTE